MKSHKHNQRVVVLLVSSLLILAACAPRTQIPATSAGSAKPLLCSETSVIEFDRLKDTAVTIGQVKAFNATWHRLCDGTAKP